MNEAATARDVPASADVLLVQGLPGLGLGGFFGNTVLHRSTR